MDQLASINCEFLDDSLDRIYKRNVEYYRNKELSRAKLPRLRLRSSSAANHETKDKVWAVADIYHGNKPVRPWALNGTLAVDNAIYQAAGKKARKPGRYQKIDPETCRTTGQFLVDTNERIHQSVRVRLACEGLGPNDAGPWRCPPLLSNWRPRLTIINARDPITTQAAWGPPGAPAGDQLDGGPNSKQAEPHVSNAEASGEAHTATEPDPTTGPDRWVWEYVGDEDDAPDVTTMIEDNLGPYERHLLTLSRGDPPVDEYAEQVGPAEFKAMQLLAVSISARAKAEAAKVKKKTRAKRKHSRKMRILRKLFHKLFP